MGVQDAIVELYGLAPGEFIAARNAKVRKLRAAGERDTAAAVAKFRRPSANQWALNMAARAKPEIAAAWADAAATVRHTQQAATSGEHVDLRAALAALRERTAELKAAAAEWASREDLGLTLNEIAGSAEATEALRAGALGAVQRSTSDFDDRAGSPSADRPAASPGKGRSSGCDQARQHRVDQAHAAVERSQGDLDAARAAVAEAVEAHEAAQATATAASAVVNEARRQLAAAEDEQATAERALRETSRSHASAVKWLDRAQQTHDRAVERLEGVSRSTGA